MNWTVLEPARIRAVGAAVVALAGALGLTLAFDLPGIVEAVAVIASLLIPLIQGEATRAKVVPVGKLPSRTGRK